MYPDIDPVAIQLGPLAVHWYGLMYGVGFLSAWLLGRYRAKQPWSPLKPAQIEDMILYTALGVILGGRIGYILFYDTGNIMADPMRLLRVWEGGMAFHGGLLGVLIAAWLFSRRHAVGFLQLMDRIAPLVPIGLGAGRIGNFINGELWGKPTDVPWAMLVDTGAGLQARHPSQLYQFLLEGVVLFTVIWLFSRKPRPTMSVSGLFLVLYGCFRIFVEFFRMPDAHIGYLAFDWLTMGQVLSLPMIALGAVLLILAYRTPNRVTTA